uniref:VgrG-related protein n=1 Tax=Collinsella aerofaciens TaxID=74426 RepID=UPI00359C9B3D
MQPKHSAIVAGLTLALSFGAVSAPAPAAAEEPTPGVASDATDIDKGLYTQQSFSGVLRSVQGVSFVNVTPEMKYFTKYESHGNYNQGFSYGDGYNALGYYQFDRRWSLIPFMKQVYNYDSAKYGMLKAAIDRGSEITNANNPMFENGQLTELGRIAQEAFQGAYNTDPVEFSALQDAYAYNSYYAVTEAWLKSGLGIDISGRADCVKGMVWSITNMCGTGGCRDFFRWANLSNDMSDREFVTALSNSVVNNVATKFSSQPQYHEGWKNRYKNELKDCLVYIAEDEAAAATPVQPEPTPAPSPTPDSNDGSSDDVNDDRMDAPSTDADGNGSAGGATNDGSTSNGSDLNGSAAGDSSSSSAGNTDSDASGSTDADTSNSSTGSSDSSADTGSNNDSGSDATPDSDASKDDSNKAPDAPVASPDKKPSFSEQLGSTLGSSLMAGVNNGSAQNKDNSDQVSMEKTEAAEGDSKDKASEKTESDKGSSSEEKDDKSTQKKDEGKKSESEGKDKNKTEDGKKQSEDDESGADNQVQEQNDSKTVTTTTTTTTKSSGGNMPKTGDLIVMASLASASLATLGATSIVSGKHKLDQQKKASGEDGSEE